jgi:mannose-6-phosphate isomerase class I
MAAPTATYDLLPSYPVVGGTESRGWDNVVDSLPRGVRTLAVDGPAVLDWDGVNRSLTGALARNRRITTVDMRQVVLPWDDVQALTESSQLRDDPDFARLAGGSLADLIDLDALSAIRGASGKSAPGLRLVIGPGAALSRPDVLWWADLPKRYAEAALSAGNGRNLAQPAGLPPSLRRLFYVDWPLLDRHRDEYAPSIDRWIDTQDLAAPTSIDGVALRATCTRLARQPFRTRPVFNSTPWGGHWAQQHLGHNPGAPNTALGYELIAPESGVLLGQVANLVEVPFQMIVSLAPEDILGPSVHDVFGTSFPIRFDYLDTMGGGNLSVHCHPRDDYMRTVFGWPYTQHESYYVMASSEGGKVFLGLREDAFVEEFERRAHEANARGIEFDIEAFVQTFPAAPHQLFLVPAGTPHGSSAGNVVLEVSATPYLYSLRFYDWLRRDRAGRQRPVHVDHAFRNLDISRVGDDVKQHLVQTPRTVTEGDGWREQLLGALPEMFFEVRRVTVGAEAHADQDTEGRFHVVTLVEGGPAMIEYATVGLHNLAYAETLAIPAAVGAYRVHNRGRARLRIVKSVVSAT